MAQSGNEQSAQTIRIKLPVEMPADECSAPPGRAAPPTASLPREAVRAKLGASEFTLYREFLQSIYDAVLIADWEGHIVDGNTRSDDFFRYTTPELRAMTLGDIVRSLNSNILGSICANLDRGRFTLIEEAYCRRKDYSVFPAEIAVNKLHLGDEKHLCLFVRDITRRKQSQKILRQARDQLARAERLELAGSIAGQIAHDFNNLLTPLVAYPEFIRSKLPENSPARADLDVIAGTARQMAHINQQLMALSRRAYHEQSVLNINSLIKAEVLSLERDEAARGMKLELALAPDLANIRGSPQQLLRVIQNLCQNAIEAMNRTGTLTIKTDNIHPAKPMKKLEIIPEGEYVQVSFADTGHGIPAEIQDKIFDPFFTTRQTDKQRGSGLGLSVVRSIVNDHHGFIDLESAAGAGAVFSLYFPACREKIAPVEPETIYSGTETILIVDDDKLQIEVMTRLLQTLGYKVESALSGHEALQLFSACRQNGSFPQLVILDMVMDDEMDGARLYQELKTVNPGQKALLLSGYSETPRVALAQALGAGAYLRKPITLEKLSKAVRQELDRTA